MSLDDDIIVPIEWDVLKATYDGLYAVMNNYDTNGGGWETLVEAKRLVEIEMREQGYERQWKALTNK